MNITNENGSVFQLNVQGYVIDGDSGGGFSADWLKGNVFLRSGETEITWKMELLIIEELEQLKEWLLMIANYEECPKRFNFLDPELGCILHKRGGKKWVKWILRVSETEIEFVDMQADDGTIENVIGQLNDILERYSCRCKDLHMTLRESRELFPYHLIYDEFPEVEKLGLVPRSFQGGYKDQMELIAGNLYLWLHQTKRILWDIDPIGKKITFYTEPIIQMGRRLATLEKIDQEKGGMIMMELVHLLSHGEMSRTLKKIKEFNDCDDPVIYQEVLSELDDEAMKKMLSRFCKMFVEPKKM